MEYLGVPGGYYFSKHILEDLKYQVAASSLAT